jgi:miniconductance mechanosensitive channel
LGELAIFLLIGIAIQKIVAFFIEKSLKRIKNRNLKAFIDYRVFRTLLLLIVPVILYAFLASFPIPLQGLTRLITCVVIIIISKTLNSVLLALVTIYNLHEVANIRPIKSYLQIAQIIGGICVGIVLFAVLAGKDPWMILSGFGALSAVLLIVFRDPLLGLMAGIQITANDMVRIGDWIELPQHRGAASKDSSLGNSKNIVAGFVTDIALITVKVQTFDKTIVSSPAYTLVSDVFRNWRGIMRKDVRHFQRTLLIDATTVKPCSAELLAALSDVPELRSLFESAVPPPFDNLSLFRLYALEVLRNHPAIVNDMRLTVRLLDIAAGRGIPLELYAFTPHHEFHAFSELHFELSTRLISMLPRFQLRLFQFPAGADLHSADR